MAQEYLDARRAQELDHTDPDLDWQRTEAHDQFLLALDVAGIKHQDREHGARIASGMSEFVALARTYVDASRARWHSMMQPPYNADKGTRHWQLAKDAAVAWQAWIAALATRSIESDDRRALAQALAQGQEEE